MAQTNYTPISLYYSTTASAVPTAANLVPGELAINTNDGKLYYEDSSGVVQVLATKSTGSIGGSTTQVQYNLSGSLAGSANLTFDGTNLTTGGTNTATRFIPSGSTVATNGMYLPAANSLGFSTNSTERMRIDSSGNVGINTSSPSSYGAFGVNKVITVNSLSGVSAGFSDGITGTLRIAHASGQNIINFDSGNLCFQGGGSGGPVERMRIDSSGNLFVNCTTTPSASVGGVQMCNPAGTACKMSAGSATGFVSYLEFINGNGLIGSITGSGSLTSYNVTSDYRLKENIAPMTGALAKVAQLKPVTYKWKVNGSDGQGFIAHELQAVVPDCVTGEKDAVDKDGKPIYQGMDTSHLVATLVSAIQELKAEVDSLKQQLNGA